MESNVNIAQQDAFRDALAALGDPALTRVSEELQTSYRAMVAQIARLNAELEAARLARREETSKRERILTRLASLLDTLPGGVLIVRGNGVITETNPRAVDLLGEPLVGENWAHIQARGHFPSRGTFEINGRKLSVRSEPLEGTDETVVLVTDITYQQTLQHELGRKSRLSALGEMAARLAHQVRTPLASTSLYLSQLETDMVLEKRREICHTLREQLAHTESLITAMLAFVRGAATEFIDTSIPEIIADAVEACSADIEASHARLDMSDIDSGLPVLGAHAELVGGISNILVNAIDASGQKPQVKIVARAINPRTAMIQISDQGTGIPSDALDRVFDPFFTTRAQGNGLGLAVLAATVNQHGGTVHAANLSQGGAQLTVLLPLSSAMSQECAA